MAGNLSRMTELLNKLSKNTPDASVSAAITSAKEAVLLQSQKDYTVQVTTETKVKTDAKTVRDQLSADLLATRKLVIAAKQSLMEGVRNGANRQEMHELLRTLSMQAWDKLQQNIPNPLFNLISNNKIINKFNKKEKLQELFDPRKHTGLAQNNCLKFLKIIDNELSS